MFWGFNMDIKQYGTFMNMKDIKKEFGIKSTATMMRLVHKKQIPYAKESAKILLFKTDAVYQKLQEMEVKADKHIRGI